MPTEPCVLGGRQRGSPIGRKPDHCCEATRTDHTVVVSVISRSAIQRPAAMVDDSPLCEVAERKDDSNIASAFALRGRRSSN
jgi:hypothetical protein